MRVKETKIETTFTISVAVANGEKNLPMSEVIIAIGSITTTFVPAEARIATVCSAAPSRAAVQRASRAAPADSKRRTTLSSTTIELETRMPAERPIARRVERLSVRPQSWRKKSEITIVTGIVTATTKVERRLTRNAKRMTAQSSTEEPMSAIVLSTLAWTISASSCSHSSSAPGGSSRRMSSTRRFSSRTVSTVLPSLFFTTFTVTPGSPSRNARWRGSSVARRTVPRSRR